MSKKTMKLALEALEAGEYYIDDLEAIVYAADDLGTHEDRAKMQEAITALREALAKPDFWEGYVPEPVKPAQQEFVSPGGGYVPAIPAQQALDKKAENARELGLDYEPVCNKDPQGCWNVRCQLGKKCKNTSAQRTWVSLTDEEIEKLTVELRDIPVTLAFAIEAKLKEKNT
jgi:hypothetical protein